MRFSSKLLFIFIVTLIIYISFTVPAQSQEILKAEQAKLLELDGKVNLKKATLGKWQPAMANLDLAQDDELKTGDNSYCIILLWDGSSVKMGENTHVRIQILKSDQKTNQSKFKLFLGKIWSSVRKATGKKTNFEVESPYTLAAVRGTVFEIIAMGDKDKLLVYEGTVEALTGSEKREIKESQLIVCGNQKFLCAAARFDSNKLNAWQKWNKDVDGEIAVVFESFQNLAKADPSEGTGSGEEKLKIETPDVTDSFSGVRGGSSGNQLTLAIQKINQMRDKIKKHKNPFTKK